MHAKTESLRSTFGRTIKFDGTLPRLTSDSPVDRGDGKSSLVLAIIVFVGLYLVLQRASVNFAAFSRSLLIICAGASVGAGLGLNIHLTGKARKRRADWNAGILRLKGTRCLVTVYEEFLLLIAYGMLIFMNVFLIGVACYASLGEPNKNQKEGIAAYLVTSVLLTIISCLTIWYLRYRINKTLLLAPTILNRTGVVCVNGTVLSWDSLTKVGILKDSFFLSFDGGDVIVNPQPLELMAQDPQRLPARQDAVNFVTCLFAPIAPRRLSSASSEFVADAVRDIQSLPAITVDVVQVSFDHMKKKMDAKRILQVPECELDSIISDILVYDEKDGFNRSQVEQCFLTDENTQGIQFITMSDDFARNYQFARISPTDFALFGVSYLYNIPLALSFDSIEY